MKIKKEDYSKLENLVKSSPVYPCLMDYRENGLSDMRYRWDCLYSSPSNIRSNVISKIYEYANDDHIDTALRKITKTKV